MKQIIGNYDKYYINDKGQTHGLYIHYWLGDVFYKVNYINDKEYGLETEYHINDLIKKHTYHL